MLLVTSRTIASIFTGILALGAAGCGGSDRGGGLCAKDISSYADGWLTQVATVFVANHLGEIVN